MDRTDLNQRLPKIVDLLVASVLEWPEIRRLDNVLLPSKPKIVAIVDALQQIIFPGYFGMQNVTHDNLPYRTGELVFELTDLLVDQISCCLRYRNAEPPELRSAMNGAGTPCADCEQESARITSVFFDRLPAVRELMNSDVKAAFEGDPAAQTPDETIFGYPGLYAIMCQRLAHELHELHVPLLPRMITEHAHSVTGIDIHPGAQLGKRFFIDHGTGVVIGETTVIGDNVKVYQGVTLGALAPAYGQALRGHKRHPTIEDDVVIYAGATILGGDTVIGRNSVIGGNVFITQTVPPFNQVIAEPPKLKYREKRPRGERSVTVDFQI